MEQRQAKPGQPYRGERTTISVRVPKDQHKVYEARAKALGLPVASYSAMRIAQHEGLDVPQFVIRELERTRARLVGEGRIDLLDLSIDSLVELLLAEHEDREIPKNVARELDRARARRVKEQSRKGMPLARSA